VCVAQFLVELVGAAVLGDAGEGIGAEVLVDVEEGHGLHQWAEDDLLVVGEVELEARRSEKSLEIRFLRLTWTVPLVRCITTAH
jgi:hypothetical protein